MKIRTFQAKTEINYENLGLILRELHSAEETGLFDRAVPENMQMSQCEGVSAGSKLCQGRISVLLCSSASNQ